MPRYIVEREFSDGVQSLSMQTTRRACVVRGGQLDGDLTNVADQVIWIHSYVGTDRKRTFCVYDAPSPEAIRQAAARNKLPVDRITEVRVLDPHFYK